MPSTLVALLPRLRAFFGLSQTDLGHCLGLSKTMVSQVERGIRGLPLPAALPQAALTLAQQSTLDEPAPEALDTAAIQQHQRACQHRAEQLTYELSQLPARAIWARRRLAALPTLTEALTPAGGAPPAWLATFAAEARAELTQVVDQARHHYQQRIFPAPREAVVAGVAALGPGSEAQLAQAQDGARP